MVNLSVCLYNGLVHKFVTVWSHAHKSETQDSFIADLCNCSPTLRALACMTVVFPAIPVIGPNCDARLQH